MSITMITYDSFIPKLSWVDAVEALKKGHFLPKAEIKDLFLGPNTATLVNRAAYVEGLGYGVKAVTVVEANAARHLPTVQGAMLFYKDQTGCLQAIIENRLITEVKTAADSVLGARLLARKESKNLLIIGAGNLASGVAHAYSAAFPGLEKISIWGRRPEQAQQLVQELAGLATPVEAVQDLAQACQQADIISTVTMAREPVLKGEWVKAGTHIDLIGAYKPDMREADDALLQKGTLFVDSFDTTVHHIGELMIPLQAKVIAESDIKEDLYTMVHKEKNRTSAEEITIYKNGGGAHLDTMVASYFVASV